MDADLARYVVAVDDGDREHLRGSGFGPHDPPYLVRDLVSGSVVEHGFRLEEAALAYAEALNRVNDSGLLPGNFR